MVLLSFSQKPFNSKYSLEAFHNQVTLDGYQLWLQVPVKKILGDFFFSFFLLYTAPKGTNTWNFSLWTQQLPWESECLTPKSFAKVHLPCGKDVSMETFTGGHRTYVGCAIRLLLHIICLKYVNIGLVILSQIKVRRNVFLGD